MRQTLILLCGLACAHVSLSQRISIAVHEVSFADFIAELKLQSGLNFIYAEEDVAQIKSVSAELIDQPVQAALKTCFDRYQLEFQMIDDFVIVRRKFSHNAIATSRPTTAFRGAVVDQEGQPVPFASLLAADGRSAVADERGRFFIMDTGLRMTVTISSVGYDARRLVIDGVASVTVVLQKQHEGLDETVIKGYYQTSRRFNTGSVSRLNTTNMRSRPVGNALTLLQGRIPGLSITQHTGVPGGRFSLTLRGRNSISSGTEPLFIIDGVPYSHQSMVSEGSIIYQGSALDYIDPNTIETIQVLKDADATAIYGSRGSNGVILIETRRPPASGSSLLLSMNNGMGTTGKRMRLLNTAQYLAMRNEAFRNDNATPKATDDDIVRWSRSRYTDWQRAITGNNALLHQVHVSYSIGKKQIRSIISMTYRRETTVFPGDFSVKRVAIHSNSVGSWCQGKIKTELVMGYFHNNSMLPSTDPTTLALTLPPNAPPPFDERGRLHWERGFQNPYALLENRYLGSVSKYFMKMALSYQLCRRVTFRAPVGLTTTSARESILNPISASDPSLHEVRGSAHFNRYAVSNWMFEPQSEWNYRSATWTLLALTALSFQESNFARRSVHATGYQDDEQLMDTRFAGNVQRLPASGVQYRYASALGRIHINYLNKYLISITGRRDASSRFGSNSRPAQFGAVGMAWIFSGERLLKWTRLISFGKLRCSYGSSGNDQIDDYGYLSLYDRTNFSYNQVPAVSPLNLANDRFHWEVTRKFELALEMLLLHDRIRYELCFYQHRSTDQLVGMSLPLYTGFSLVQQNIPAVIENRGWEMDVDADIVASKWLKWTMSLNLSFPRNKLLAFPGMERTAFADRYMIGKSLGILPRFRQMGVNTTSGLYKFDDIDHNGIYLQYPADLSYERSLDRRMFGGMSHMVEFGRWTINTVCEFVQQTGFNYMRLFPAPGSMSNQPALVLDRWQKAGDRSSVQKFTQAASPSYNVARYTGDNHLTDASFLRLKTCSIIRDITPKGVRTKGFEKMQLFAAVENAITITKYLGLDPENQGALPPLRIISLGFQMQL